MAMLILRIIQTSIYFLKYIDLRIFLAGATLMKDGMYETLISAPAPSKPFELVLNNLNDIGRFYEAYPEDEAI